MMAAALSTHVAGLQQIVIVDGDRVEEADDLARALARMYLPFAVSVRVDRERQAALAPHLPFIDAMKPANGHAAAYVCRDFACRQPVTSAEALEQELRATG